MGMADVLIEAAAKKIDAHYLRLGEFTKAEDHAATVAILAEFFGWVTPELVAQVEVRDGALRFPSGLFMGPPPDGDYFLVRDGRP